MVIKILNYFVYLFTHHFMVSRNITICKYEIWCRLNISRFTVSKGQDSVTFTQLLGYFLGTVIPNVTKFYQVKPVDPNARNSTRQKWCKCKASRKQFFCKNVRYQENQHELGHSHAQYIRKISRKVVFAQMILSSFRKYVSLKDALRVHLEAQLFRCAYSQLLGTVL